MPALRYNTLKVEIEKDRRFKLTRIGQCNSGFRLSDWSRGQYAMVTSVSLAHCHSEWLRLKDETLNIEQKQAIEVHYVYVEQHRWATKKQLDYINRMRQKQGLPFLPAEPPVLRGDASSMIAELSSGNATTWQSPCGEPLY